MNTSLVRKLLALSVAGLLVTGCGDSSRTPEQAAPATPAAPPSLSALLPGPPPGWKLAERHAEEKVGDAGLHSWAVYRPEGGDAATLVDRVEVNLSVVRSGEKKDATSNLAPSTKDVQNFALQTPHDELLKLRRLPGGSQWMEAIEIAGRRASASGPMYQEQIISLTPAANRHIDVVVYAREKPADFDASTRLREIGRSFVEKIDSDKLKEVNEGN